MKYLYLILLIFSLGCCNKKDEKINFEINQTENGINKTEDIVLYYGIADGSGRDFGECEVFFIIKNTLLITFHMVLEH